MTADVAEQKRLWMANRRLDVPHSAFLQLKHHRAHNHQFALPATHLWAENR